MANSRCHPGRATRFCNEKTVSRWEVGCLGVAVKKKETTEQGSKGESLPQKRSCAAQTFTQILSVKSVKDVKLAQAHHMQGHLGSRHAGRPGKARAFD